MTEDSTEQPKGELTVRLIAMPSDTNANGDIFGGWVLSQMDQAGGIAAVEAAEGRVVTVAIEAMHFIRPVKVGDVLCVYTSIGHIGRTSLKVNIEAWARRFRGHHREKVTDATFTFVAIDDQGRPRPVVREQAKEQSYRRRRNEFWTNRRGWPLVPPPTRKPSEGLSWPTPYNPAAPISRHRCRNQPVPMPDLT